MKGATVSRRMAVLFHRIGPYHFARLRASGKVAEVTAIEFSNRDSTYAWDPVPGQAGFERVTLFHDVAVETQSGRQVDLAVCKALSQVRPEVVAIPGWSHCCSLAALRWCLRQRVPAVLMSETTAWDQKRSFWKEALKRRVVNVCSTGLVGGRSHVEYLGALGMPRQRIFLGYDAVDNDYFRQRVAEIRREAAAHALRPAFVRAGCPSELEPGDTGAAERYGLPGQYFLASARFVAKKNLPRLLEAYAAYRVRGVGNGSRESTNPGQDGGWDLVLLGDGPLRRTLETQIASLNLRSHVHLPGFKQYAELPAYYARANAFIHPSTTEPWGLVVNEAMASGLPMLVSERCGCCSELMSPGKNGFTFDPLDVGQMAGLMQKIAAVDAETRRQMGLESQRLVAAWGPERFASGLNQAAEAACRLPRPSPSGAAGLWLRLLAAR